MLPVGGGRDISCYPGYGNLQQWTHILHIYYVGISSWCGQYDSCSASIKTKISFLEIAKEKKSCWTKLTWISVIEKHQTEESTNSKLRTNAVISVLIIYWTEQAIQTIGQQINHAISLWIVIKRYIISMRIEMILSLKIICTMNQRWIGCIIHGIIHQGYQVSCLFVSIETSKNQSCREKVNGYSLCDLLIRCV